MSGGRSRSQRYQNKTSFVPKRDIKRTDRERVAESALRSLACAGVCARCAAKARWRFQMGKYKARKNGQRGRCAACELKTVRLAYRSACDACAAALRVCPGCMKTAAETAAAAAAGVDDVVESEDEDGSESDDASEDEHGEDEHGSEHESA